MDDHLLNCTLFKQCSTEDQHEIWEGEFVFCIYCQRECLCDAIISGYLSGRCSAEINSKTEPRSPEIVELFRLMDDRLKMLEITF